MNTLSRVAVAGVAGLVLAAAGTGQVLGAQQTSAGDAQWVERMQNHWQKVINETDPQRRSELMREHEQIMAQAMESDRDRGVADGSHMGMDADHVDMMNTVDMHQHMLDMMRRSSAR